MSKDGIKRMAIVQVRLARDSLQTPWGFRLQGGKDLNQQLTIQRVFSNTPSEGELHRGDVIVAINGRDTSSWTHKQAQDVITGGGGQIEFLVQRPPPGQVHIKPLSPIKDTRAPVFPQSPTKAPQIVIPIQRRAGPPSPTKVIPVSPQKPSPPKPSPPKPSPKPVRQQDSDMSAGFTPTKVTMNKYGGGTMNFGYGPTSPTRQAQAPTYRPVAAPAHDQYDYVHQTQTQSQTQFSAPQQSHTQQEERGVEEEEYGGVSDRRRTFMKADPSHPHFSALGVDENDYPTAPVWERRRLFGKKQPRPPAVQRSRKPPPNFGRPRLGEEVVSFGVDYTRPQAPKSATKHSSAPAKQRPPAVNARRPEDEYDGPSPWSNTLRGERNLKPWELEALEAERYQTATADEPYRPSMAPSVAPKPRITQITTQSRAVEQHSAPAGHRSVSPYATKSQSRSPIPPSYSPSGVAGSRGDGPSIVHLQYNSPMGLYSKDNIQDTYVGQTQGRALSSSDQAKPQQPLIPGERDWSDSAVYKMVHSTQKTTTSSRQDGTGQAPTGETVTTTRTSHETRYPGQEPQRHVTETVQRGGAPELKYDPSIGMSDF